MKKIYVIAVENTEFWPDSPRKLVKTGNKHENINAEQTPVFWCYY